MKSLLRWNHSSWACWVVKDNWCVLSTSARHCPQCPGEPSAHKWPPCVPPSDMLSITTSFFCFPSINNKLQQPEAAAGVLEYAMKHFGELVSASFLLEKQDMESWLGGIRPQPWESCFRFVFFSQLVTVSCWLTNISSVKETWLYGVYRSEHRSWGQILINWGTLTNVNWYLSNS